MFQWNIHLKSNYTHVLGFKVLLYILAVSSALCSNQLHYISDEIYMNSVYSEDAEFVSALNIDK